MPVQTFDSIEDALRAGVKVPGYELPEPPEGTTPKNTARPRRKIYDPVTEWGDTTVLRLWAETLTDAKKARISAHNRAGRYGAAGDETTRAALTASADAQEKLYENYLLDAYHANVPTKVQDFMKGIPGLGDGVLPARIIGVLGNPRIAVPLEWTTDKVICEQYVTKRGKAPKRVLIPQGDPFERTPGQLWQYAGCGDPLSNPRGDILGHTPSGEEKLRGGKRTTVRPLLYAFTSSLLRSARFESIAQSDYYNLLLRVKVEAQGKTHTRQCQNKQRPPMGSNGCGTAAHPEWGAPGSEWRPGHILAHAHRLVQKQFLLDLWRVSGD